MINEINILCVGEIVKQASVFLQRYTNAQMKQAISPQYQIFVIKQSVKGDAFYVFLHQVKEQLQGIHPFVKYSFDGILFFVKIDAYHKTLKNVLESLKIYSSINGRNIYKIPLKVVAVPKIYGQQYGDISSYDKHKLYDQMSPILNQDAIICVQYDQDYMQKLSKFYRQIMVGEFVSIKQNMYSKVLLQGTSIFSISQIKLSMQRFYEKCKNYIFSKQIQIFHKYNKFD